MKASILLEHNRVKSRISIEDKDLWETIESLYENTLLTEERLHEQQAVFNWISKLGKGAYNTIKSYTDKASGEVKKMAQDLADQVESQPIGGEIKKLLKKGDWSGAFKAATKWIKGEEAEGKKKRGKSGPGTYGNDDVFPGPKDGGISNLFQPKPEGGENLQEQIQWLNDKWRNMKVGSKVSMVLLMLTIMFAKADMTKAGETYQDGNIGGYEQVDTDGSIDKKGFTDNNETTADLDSPLTDFDTGVQFEFGTSNLDAAGQQQVLPDFPMLPSVSQCTALATTLTLSPQGDQFTTRELDMREQPPALECEFGGGSVHV